MKTKFTSNAVAVAIMLLLNPSMLRAQWNAVRFDQHNTFYNVTAPTSNTVFITGIEPATSQYFIIRTNDAGNTWDSIPFNNATDTFALTQLYFFNASIGFAGGIKNGFQVLMKTTDNGNNWTEVTPNPASTEFINSVQFVDPQNGVASDGLFLYKTIDGGATWTSQATPLNSVRGLFFEDMNNGFASGYNAAAEIIQTSDGGQTWNNILTASDPDLFVSSFAKMDFVSSDVGYTAIESSAMFFRTSDAGQTWQPIVIDSVRAIRDFDFISADTGHVLAEIGWMQEFRILLTVDGGQSWTMEYTTGWNWYGGGVVLNAFTFINQTGYTSGSHGLVKKYDMSSTAISEEELNGGANVYPNPFSISATLRLADWSELQRKNAVPSDIGVRIYDAFGREVFFSEVVQQEVELERGNLAGGIYVYTVSNGNEVVAKGKLVVVD